jgi:hypothetical protein
MPDTKARSEWTADDYRESTENARRSARYLAAQERIKRIVAGSPPLTEQQLADLAVLLHGGGGVQ